jgi:hypothetical protein
MRTTNNNTTIRTILARAAGCVIAGAAALFGAASPASAGGPDFGVGLRPEMRHVWVPAAYEDRETRVWIEPVYRTWIERVWVAPVYRTVTERVWVEGAWRDVTDRVFVPAMYKTVCEDVWVEPVYRTAERFDRCGRPVGHERIMVRPGHFEKRQFTRQIRGERWDTVIRRDWAGGHWEDRTRQVVSCEGYWRDVTRTELVAPGRWEVRRERVCVREGHWEDRPTGRHEVDVRFDGFAARFPLGR